jgi:hypothetical protein
MYDRTVDWFAEFPDAGLDLSCAGELALIQDLMLLDMGELYKKLIINDVKKILENMHEKVVERA